MGVYDQFIWFGDSLTQQAWGGQEEGFGAGAAMQNCESGGFFPSESIGYRSVFFCRRSEFLWDILMKNSLSFLYVC